MNIVLFLDQNSGVPFSSKSSMALSKNDEISPGCTVRCVALLLFPLDPAFQPFALSFSLALSLSLSFSLCVCVFVCVILTGEVLERMIKWILEYASTSSTDKISQPEHKGVAVTEISLLKSFCFCG